MGSAVSGALAPMRSRPSKKRLDVQALRALAIVLVLVYHAFPTVVPGGFVGVDVFFVISGFLITLLLLRELQSTGRINLWSFYARRVRRLMPAALTTTVVTVAVAALLVGPVKLIAIVKDAMWTTAYLANVRFGMSPDGYFVGGEKSPLLHFWSLAVEEQFYLFWPLLLILLAAVAGARWRGSLPVLLLVILAGSLLASVVLTGSQWGHAYFSLATRAWELAIGAGVAAAVFCGVKLPVRHWVAAIGLLAVLWSAFGYSESTAFPGIAAVVPTVGTALLVWAGASGPVRYERAVGWRPIQFLGDVSYSLYLWHWPALILGRLVIGAGWVQSAALVLVSVLLAAASFYLLERRVSGLRPALPSFRVVVSGTTAAVATFAWGAVVMAAIPVTGGARTTQAAPADASGVLVKSRIVVTPPKIVTPHEVPANMSPPLPELTGDLAEVFTNGCFAAGLVVCEGGEPAGQVRVVLAGDSHAGQWWPAADAAAKANGWKLFMVGKNGCPLSFVKVSKADTAEAWPECTQWQRAAVDAVVAIGADVIVYANNVQGYAAKVSLRDDFAASWAAGVEQVLPRLTDGAAVVALGQQPKLAVDPGVCLSENLQDVGKCSTASDAAVPADVAAEIERLAEDAGAYYVDVVDLLCTDVCPVMDHNLVMYRDIGHLSRTYSEFLAPVFAATIDVALRG